MSRTRNFQKIMATSWTTMSLPNAAPETKENFLDMPAEKRALLREYIAAVKPFIEKGIEVQDPTTGIAKALFVRDLVELMDKWGIWLDGDLCQSLTMKHDQGQEYGLDDDGDFRADDGAAGGMAARGAPLAIKPAPLTAHNKLKTMAHRMAAVERFLGEEGGAA